MQDGLIPIRGKEINGMMSLSSFEYDDLLEKLKIMNFEKHLIRELKMKPLGKFSLVKSVNPGEQFFMFTLISWWLCNKLGLGIEKPEETDDPNEFILKIMQVLDSAEVPPDFQTNKLISGAGPTCLFVLSCLATRVLKIVEINCQRLYITEDDEKNVEYLDEQSEIILEKLDDNDNGEHSDESDMDLESGMKLTPFNLFSKKSVDYYQCKNKDDNAMDHLSDQQAWHLELERVIPRLKVLVKSDTRDWRSHFSQIDALTWNMDTMFDETQLRLKKLYSEFTYIQDKVESREKHLNNELQNLIVQFKEVSIELSSLQHTQAQVQKDTDNFLLEFNNVVIENTTKRTDMEKRGKAMSDGSSVLHIKKAIAKLKDDVSELNLEVALIAHSIDKEIQRHFNGSELKTRSKAG